MELARQHLRTRDASNRSAPLLAAHRQTRPVTVRAIIAEDVVLISHDPAALAGALGAAGAVRGVKTVASVAAVAGLRAALIVLHTSSPVEHTRHLMRVRRGTPVLVVVRQFQPSDVIPTLRAGALGLLVEGAFTRAELAAAVAGGLHGHGQLSGAALTALVRQLHDPTAALTADLSRSVPAAPVPHPALSDREHEVMNLVAAGWSNPDIAAQLFLAEKTVRNHVTRIYRKLAVRNRAEATAHWLNRD